MPPKNASSVSDAKQPLPWAWYAFFGIVEPISVLAGAIYAVALPGRYNAELVPPAFLLPAAAARGVLKAASQPAKGLVASLWPKAAGGAAHAVNSAASGVINASAALSPASGMALGQLGSCYILIMLNSLAFFHLFYKHVSHDAALQERGVALFLLVLGVADWTHIGLTLWGLPSPSGPLSKLTLLLRPSSWNSLLFGNVIITFLLFSARLAWAVGVGRDVVRPFPCVLSDAIFGADSAPRTPAKEAKDK